VAEEIVHDVLLYIWEHRHQLTITTSLKSYLYAAVKNRALDYLKSQYARQVHESEVPEQIQAAAYPDEELHLQELQTIIQQAIEQLPEKCRLIFRMSRNANLSYKEIAEQLDISPKTVEAQMGIALQRLRKYVEAHWELVWWLPLLYLFS
jgi:RNA polymerase sigma-70 factor (ECF subfamily)